MTAAPWPTRDLSQWVDDAHHALTEWAEGRGDRLSVDTLRALVAAPDRTGRSASDRQTFWLEEYGRVMKDQLRDTFPIGGGEVAVAVWQQRQSARHAQLDSLLDAHAECLVATGDRGALAEGRQTKRRRTAASDYLLTLERAA